MFIHKRDKKTGRDTLLTVDQFLADITKVFDDTTKHRKLAALAALVEGRFYQNLEISYYILEAVSKYAREQLAKTKVGLSHSWVE